MKRTKRIIQPTTDPARPSRARTDLAASSPPATESSPGLILPSTIESRAEKKKAHTNTEPVTASHFPAKCSLSTLAPVRKSVSGTNAESTPRNPLKKCPVSERNPDGGETRDTAIERETPRSRKNTTERHFPEGFLRFLPDAIYTCLRVVPPGPDLYAGSAFLSPSIEKQYLIH